MLPKHLLINGELCTLTIQQNTGGVVASYTFRAAKDHSTTVAEYAGTALVAAGTSEENARMVLKNICERLELIHSKWYAKR